MPSFDVTLTDTYTEIIRFDKYRVTYFNIEIELFDSQATGRFTFGPPDRADVEIVVPPECATSRDNRPLKGVLYGKIDAGATQGKITIW